MKIVHMVTCGDCGYPAFEIERGNGMHKYFCKRCNLIFIKYDEEQSRRKREF